MQRLKVPCIYLIKDQKTRNQGVLSSNLYHSAKALQAQVMGGGGGGGGKELYRWVKQGDRQSAGNVLWVTIRSWCANVYYFWRGHLLDAGVALILPSVE